MCFIIHFLSPKHPFVTLRGLQSRQNVQIWFLFGACLFTEQKTCYPLSLQPGTGCIILVSSLFLNGLISHLKRWSKRQKLTKICENLLFYTRGEKWPNILESNVDFSPSDVDFFVRYQNTLRNSSPCVFSSYSWNSPTKQEQDLLKIQSAKQEETLWNLKCSTIRHLCWT